MNLLLIIRQYNALLQQHASEEGKIDGMKRTLIWPKRVNDDSPIVYIIAILIREILLSGSYSF
jgi:hypothetical protein